MGKNCTCKISNWDSLSCPEHGLDTRNLIPHPLLGGIRIVEDKFMTVRIQVRKHRKKRLNKKWRKKYGFHILPMKNAIHLPDGTIICHPTVANAIRNNSKM